MPEQSANTARRIGGAIFLSIVFLGFAALSPYFFDLLVATAPDIPMQTLAEQIGAAPTAAQEIPPDAALKQITERDQQLSTTYAWVDQKQGIVRVPVERARKFVLEKGLPSR